MTDFLLGLSDAGLRGSVGFSLLLLVFDHNELQSIPYETCPREGPRSADNRAAGRPPAPAELLAVKSFIIRLQCIISDRLLQPCIARLNRELTDRDAECRLGMLSRLRVALRHWYSG